MLSPGQTDSQVATSQTCIDRASDRLRQKKGKFCGIFKGNYAAKKVHYAANYAIFLKLI